MKISSQQLLNLPVETQSGQYLGRISRFEIEIDTHQIIKYYIRSNKFISLFSKELIIDTHQVISITREKMIVQDNIPGIKTIVKNKEQFQTGKVAPLSF